MKKSLLLLFILLQQNLLFGQTATIEVENIRTKLLGVSAKHQDNVRQEKKNEVSIQLPMPDGKVNSFWVVETQVMSNELARQFPEIKTYLLYNFTHKNELLGTLTTSPSGIYAQINDTRGNVMIAPQDFKKLHKVVYESVSQSADAVCRVDNNSIANQILHSKNLKPNTVSSYSSGATLRTYKMAIAVTGEFYVANGNSAATAQAAVVSVVNSLKAVYEKEVSISFNLVATKLYTNAATDPFDPNASNLASEAANGFASLAVSEAATFAFNLYDIGHVLTNGAGGQAQLGTPCANNASKGAGWSGVITTSFITFIHEVGHQFSANHTFNSASGACGLQISPNAAYEPGSGYTYMTYSGGCPPDDYPGASAINRTYFHTNSLESIITFATTTGTCSVNTATGNAVPVINAGTAYTVPKGTPFVLKGSGTDANGDDIYYNWEEYDLGTTTGGAAAAAGTTDSPIFRSFDPSTTGNIRSFPKLSSVLTGSLPSTEEALPTVGRTMTFRLTGRDKKALGGGTACASVQVTVSGTAGPLAITYPAGSETIAANSSQTITWSVNNTNTLSANVNIYLSVDGGNTFPYLLIGNTLNDGTETLTIPSYISNTTEARLKIVSTNSNTAEFYNISGSFTINSTCLTKNTTICPAVAVTGEAGSNVLNLNMGFVSGRKLISKAVGYGWGGSAQQPLINYTDNTFTTCQASAWGNAEAITLSFRVTKSGSYQISIDGGLMGPMAFSVFNSTTYNCASFVGSSAWGAVQWNQTATVTMNECTTYFVLVYSTIGNPTEVNVAFQGAGDIIEADVDPVGYDYTFAAVNQTTNQIVALSATANFTSLGAGNYTVYGIQYVNGVNTAPFLNKTIEQVYALGNCILFSNNTKSLTITPSTCPQNKALVSTADDIATGTVIHKSSQTIVATNKVTGGNATYQTGNSITLNTGFEVSRGAVFKTQFGGCN